MEAPNRPRRRFRKWTLIAIPGLLLLGAVAFLQFRKSPRSSYEKAIAWLIALDRPYSVDDHLAPYFAKCTSAEEALALWDTTFFPENSNPLATDSEKVAAAALVERAIADIDSLSDSDKKTLSDSLEQTTDFLDQLEELVSYSCLVNPKNRGKSLLEWKMPRLNGLNKNLKREIYTRGRLAAEQGRLPEAARCCTLGLRFGQLLLDEPLIIDTFLGISILSNTTDLIHDVYSGREPEEKELVRLIALLEPGLVTNSIQTAMETERLFPLQLAEMELSGNTPVASQPSASPASSFGNSIGQYIVWRDLQYVQEMMIRIQDVMQLPFPEAMKQLGTIQTEVDSLSFLHEMAKILLTAYSTPRRFEMTVEGEANIRMARLALATRLYQVRNAQLPSSLDDLAPDILDSIPSDPFTESSFEYVPLSDTDFGILSPGPNGVCDTDLSSSNPSSPGFWIAGDDKGWLDLRGP